MKRVTACLTLFVVLSLAVLAAADVPRTISYQGRLTDDSGNPLDTTVSMEFAIYDDSTGGTAWWTEVHPAVSVISGGFSVILGTTNPIDDSVFVSDERWLGIVVGSDSEITPRTELTSVPYAMHAAFVDGFSPGPNNNYSGVNTFVAGDSNTVLSDYSSITGGYGNTVEVINIGDTTFDTTGMGGYSVGKSLDPRLVQDNGAILGGYSNTVNGFASAVVHGWGNQANGAFTFIGGGFRNVAGNSTNQGSVVGGGANNTGTGFCSVIGGGLDNDAFGMLSFIGGGGGNISGSICATVNGGLVNSAGGLLATVSGGGGNIASSNNTTIGGGNSNTASSRGATVSGGENNTATGQQATVSGGSDNGASFDMATVGGGDQNNASGAASTIAGGQENQAPGGWSSIGGGIANNAGGMNATIGGGADNDAGGSASTVPGGSANAAMGDNSFAAGRRAKVGALDHGTFVWADNTAADFQSTGEDQFLIRANGGVGIGTNSPDPASQLDVNGRVRMTGFQMPSGAVDGRVLTCDANGVGTWQTGGAGGGNTLDDAYDEGGAGAGRIITADAGHVEIAGSDGLRVAGNVAVGDISAPTDNDGIYYDKDHNTSSYRRGVNVEIGNLSIGSLFGVKSYVSRTAGISGSAYGGYHEVFSDGSLRIGCYGYATLLTTENNIGDTYGVRGYARRGATSYGVYGVALLAATNWAGYFSGNVKVTGTFENPKSAMVIDHPLDPENQYLYHSSVNSPDMMNVYNGNVTLDAEGKATVELPAYFEALNQDYRYQLTCIGGYAPVYIAEKISGNRFVIAGGTPSLEVSWQVTGIRADALAKSDPMQVEVEKSEREKGLYLSPDAFGQGNEKYINYEQDRLPEGDPHSESEE